MPTEEKSVPCRIDSVTELDDVQLTVALTTECFVDLFLSQGSKDSKLRVQSWRKSESRDTARNIRS